MSDWTPKDGVDENEDDEEQFSITRGREGTIYLIDADKEITGNEKRFQECLECIEADLLKGIMVNSSDLVSIVFYNTEKSPLPSNIFKNNDELSPTIIPPNCAVLIPLKPLSKEVIQYFKNFCKSDDFFDFANRYGTSTGSNFSEALWLCSRLIIRCSYKLNNSKIVLFTNNKQPHMPGSIELHQTFTRAKDLKMNNIIVDLVPMVDGDFDMDLFFKEFLCAVCDLEPDEFRWNSPEDQRYVLKNRLYRANFRKNCLRHIKWELGDDLFIGCDLHSFTRRAQKPSAINIVRETNEVAVAKRSYFITNPNLNLSSSSNHVSDSNEKQNNENELSEVKVFPAEMCKSQSVCGTEILFTSEELITIKSLIEPGIRLLGFKPLSQLKQKWFVKHCSFLYPEESKIKGSTKLFRALWEKCLEKQKYALCAMTYRRKVSPKYIALVPQSEETDGNDGFRIVHLPVETNISYLEAATIPATKVADDMIDLFERLCKKLRCKYSPESFGNPSLQSFYSTIESLVFDEDGKEIVDLTLPNTQMQDERIADFLQPITDLFGTDQAAKRTNDGNTDENRAKSTKNDMSLPDIEQAIRNDRVSAVTVQNLKDFIKSKNAHPSTGVTRKNDLFDFAKSLID